MNQTHKLLILSSRDNGKMNDHGDYRDSLRPRIGGEGSLIPLQILQRQDSNRERPICQYDTHTTELSHDQFLWEEVKMYSNGNRKPSKFQAQGQPLASPELMIHTDRPKSPGGEHTLWGGGGGGGDTIHRTGKLKKNILKHP